MIEFNFPQVPERGTENFRKYAATVMSSEGPWCYTPRGLPTDVETTTLPKWDWHTWDYFIMPECVKPIELPHDLAVGDTVVTNYGEELEVLSLTSGADDTHIRTTRSQRGDDTWSRVGEARNWANSTTRWLVDVKPGCRGIVCIENAKVGDTLVTNKGHYLKVLELRPKSRHVASQLIPGTCRDLWHDTGHNTSDKTLWITGLLRAPIALPSDIKRGDTLITQNGERLKVLKPLYIAFKDRECVLTTTMANGVANLWTLNGKNSENPDNYWIVGVEKGQLRWYTPEEGMQLIFDWPARFIVRKKDDPKLWWTSVVMATHSCVYICGGHGYLKVDEGNFASYQYTHNGKAWHDFGEV